LKNEENRLFSQRKDPSSTFPEELQTPAIESTAKTSVKISI
jgi:hypothetical protein